MGPGQVIYRIFICVWLVLGLAWFSGLMSIMQDQLDVLNAARTESSPQRHKVRILNDANLNISPGFMSENLYFKFRFQSFQLVNTSTCRILSLIRPVARRRGGGGGWGVRRPPPWAKGSIGCSTKGHFCSKMRPPPP